MVPAKAAFLVAVSHARMGTRTLCAPTYRPSGPARVRCRMHSISLRSTFEVPAQEGEEARGGATTAPPGGPGGCWQGGPAAQSGVAASDRTPGDVQQVRVRNGDADRESSWLPYSPAKLHAVAGAVARLAAHEHHSTLGLEAIDG